MESIICLLIIAVIILIILCLFKKEHFNLSDIKDLLFDKIDVDDNIEVEDLIDDEKESEFLNPKYKLPFDTDDVIFESNKFHPDYIDVINFLNFEYNNNTPSQKLNQFNKDNLPTIINNQPSLSEINKSYEIIESFVRFLNTKISDNKFTNKWINKPEQEYKDGFERVRESLGLPQRLYNKSITCTPISLISYYNLTTEKVIESDETLYSVLVLINREQTKDNMLFKFKYTINDSKITIVECDILGFDNDRQVKSVYKDINNVYKFKNLDHSNIISSSDILNELQSKYAIKEKIMQDNIDNLHPEDKFMHMRINPYNYDGIRITRTIYDDINDKPLWESEMK